MGNSVSKEDFCIRLGNCLNILHQSKQEVEFESDDYDTIGGYCLQLLDHLPEENETIFTEDDVVIKIKEVDKNRIERIYIRVPEKEVKTDEN